MKIKFKNKKMERRIVSIMISAAVVMNCIPFAGNSDMIGFSTAITASAQYQPVNEKTYFSGNNFTFNTIDTLIDYSYYYQTDSNFAAAHKNDLISIAITDGNTKLSKDFLGLGTEQNPFSGTLKFASTGSYIMKAHRAFFAYLADSAKIKGSDDNTFTLSLERLSNVGDNESAPVLADHVVHDENGEANWNVEIKGSCTFSGAIGEIGEKAKVNLTFTNNTGNNIVSNASNEYGSLTDVGAVCGTMRSGSSLTLTYNESVNSSITSANGNAGGLVGTMEDNAVLNIVTQRSVFSPTVTANGLETDNKGYAGGLVGKLNSSASVKLNNSTNLSTLSVRGTVIGSNGAGGLYGHYTYKSAATVDINNYNVSASVYGKYCGGLFGVLGVLEAENNLTITNTDTSGKSYSSGTGSDYDYTGYFGGVAGKFTTTALSNTLTLENLTVNPTSNASFNAFGGVIGIVDSAAYIKADNVTVNATGTAQRTSLSLGICENYAYFGGLIGATSTTDGVFVDVGDFILTTTENFCGGGIVGRFNNGVLRLSGTTDMKSAKPAGGYGDNATSLRYSNYGQLVGYNDNVLVYALGDGSDENPSYNNGWRYERSSGAISDDLGTWGEVVRVFNVEGTNKNAEQAGIVNFNSTEHTVTLANAETSIGSTVAFAKTALNIMLNNKTDGTDYDCLKFTSGDGNKRNTLLSTTLTLTDNIDLSKTGINGFMRDGDFDIDVTIDPNNKNIVVTSNITSSDIGDVGTFTGTLDGNNNTVTLAIGESYGLNSDGSSATDTTEGTGQIYRHCYNGLFAVIGNGNDNTGTVNDLTVDGTVNVHNAGANGMNIGGIAARSHGSTILNNITANQTVNYYENRDSNGSTEVLGHNIGGLIAYVDNNSDNGTIAVTGTTEIKPNFNFSGQYKNWLTYGGAIGKVASNIITINIAQDSNEKLTVGMQANISIAKANVGENSYCGGLIGYITANGDYNNRIVHINNLYFDNCKVENCATKNGGGFLGYSWLNTKVTIDGPTVTDGTLNCPNGAANVGVMCYNATGVWNVKSLTIENLTMSDGGGTSLGMLVNKAYNRVLIKDNNYDTKGLYLNVFNSGYNLNGSGITLPSELGIYDEIAAYSAYHLDSNNKQTTKNVLTGGAGVISINMNTDRNGTETKITTTGTYQNQLKSESSNALADTNKYANPYSRYYYNLDKMKSTDDGQNLLLWSVNKYAASNIKGEFETTLEDNNLNGSADLTGLSFYPLASADNYTIGDLTLTFDYSRLYNAETNTTYNNDSYTRDPGESNQHYLMHSGLFLNVPTGNTVTISGELSLSGTFLELGGTDVYSGVLVSQTVNGNIKSASGSKIKLNGIKPKTTGNAECQDGYLLINNIERESDLTAAPDIYIEGVYTTNKYSTTSYNANSTNDTVAKSLIGLATGKGLKIVFSKIKLDSRDGTSTDTSLKAKAEYLYNAYGTYNSIFTESTLLASIKTDQNATLEYNYTYDEDWGTGNRHVTYGKEVTDSKEYTDEENKYYGDKRYFTNPLDDTELTKEYEFSSGFLPYVYTGYSKTEGSDLYNREMKVNVMTAFLDKGCGTYNDPYVITDGKQLEAVAKFISSGLTSDLSQLNLPKKQLDGITVNATGNRWCSDKNNTEYHNVFNPSVYDSTKYLCTADNTTTWSSENVQYYLANAYYKINNDITLSDRFVGFGGTQANTAFRGVIVGSKKVDETPQYTITNKSNNPFIKVSNGSVVKDLNIVVQNNITLTQDKSGSNDAYFDYNNPQCSYYGGIIGEIMGGDNIIDNSYVSYQYIETGETKTSKITLSGNYGMLCPVGSYVGVIVFGGLIFKNINEKTANDNASPSNFVVNFDKDTTSINIVNESSKGAIYVNPLVGRVINGYAVNETTQFSETENNEYHYDDSTTDDRKRNGTKHLLKNNTKHYTIADIDPSLNKLNVTKVPTGTKPDGSQDGTINIPNSQAFFILSLITQSCSGTAKTADGIYYNSLSYGTNTTVYGMSHIADYNEVGTTETDRTKVADYNNLASKDTAANTAVPYIIAHYTKPVDKSATDKTQVYPARCVTSTQGYYDINLTESVKYVLPDSFRGIGSVGRMNNSAISTSYYTFKVDTFDGKNCNIDIDMYINRYYNKIDNYFDYLHISTNQLNNKSDNSNTLEFDNNARIKVNGFGLFDTVIMKGKTSAIKEFTLSGSVNVESYKYYTTNSNPTGEEDKAHHDDTFGNVMWLSVGGVCGWSRNGYYVMFENIDLKDLSLRGPCKVAGLLGESGISSKDINVSVKECGADNLSLELTNGGASDKEAYRNSIGAFVGKVAEGKVVVDGGINGKTVKLKKFSILSGGGYGYSAGGLVAYAGHGCQVKNMTVSPVGSETITIGNKEDSDTIATAMAGGLVGLMQPYSSGSPECLATFENCKVININVKSKKFSGGFYGGTWDDHGGWIPYKITIDNCKMLGSSDEKNQIYGGTYAGGFVGNGSVYTNAEPNIEITDCIVSNYEITAGNAGYVGGFIGQADAEASDASVTCYIHDSSVEDCILGANNNNYSGGAIGKIAQNTENKVLGYNIKLKNITSGNTIRMGAWVGHATTDTVGKVTKIQFTGMAIYGDGFSKNVGNGVTLNNASFVFADYNGTCNNADSGGNTPNISKFNYNPDTHVDMPKYPYVNIYPQSNLGTGEIITGDGAVLNSSDFPELFSYDDNGTKKYYPSHKTMAAKIYADIQDENNSRRYTTFKDDVISSVNGKDYSLIDYMKRTTDDDGDRISTFETERKMKLQDGVDDFAVVVIATSDNAETTNLINRYIQLVTNTTTDYTALSDYYKIEVNTCKYSDGKFSITNDNPGLTWENGIFALNNEYADSKNTDTFTLVDVQFLDPLGKDKIAYHLYVPVYTIKEIAVNFYAVAKTGSHSVSYKSGNASTEYSSLNNASTEYSSLMSGDVTHADSLDTWMTHYIRYEYQADDINTLLNSGKVQWNYKKSINFETFTAGEDDNPLPETTYMSLVDLNGNSDQVYYAKAGDMTSYEVTDIRTKQCWTIDLSKFKNDNNEKFTVASFNKMIAKDIIVTKNDGKGKYDLVTSEDTYDVYCINNGEMSYYRFNNNNEGNYDLKVDDNYKLYEDYYISIYVPKPDNYTNELYHYKVIPPTRLYADKDKIDYIGSEPKVRSAGVTKPHECTILVADLFKQTLEDRLKVTPNNEQITANNKKIKVDVSVLVEPNNPSGVLYLNLNSNDLFHSFYISLVRNSENGVENDIKGLSPSNITAKYSIDSEVNEDSATCTDVDLQENYLNIQTASAEQSSDLIGRLQTNSKFEIKAVIEMDFDEEKLTEEFPERNSSENFGVNVAVASNLAYDSSTLAYTSMTQPYEKDRHYYYIESVPSAKLIYSSKKDDTDQYDQIGLNSKNQSTLGINGKYVQDFDRTSMPVNTEAFYNVQSLSGAKDAKKLQLTFTLSKKTDAVSGTNGTVTGVTYEHIDKMEDFLDGEITFTSGTAKYNCKAKGNSVTAVLYVNQCSMSGDIYDIAITFNAKTGGEFKDYANYKVDLKAELYYDDDNGESNVDNSVAQDYLIYTNAKVYAEVIR